MHLAMHLKCWGSITSLNRSLLVGSPRIRIPWKTLQPCRIRLYEMCLTCAVAKEVRVFVAIPRYIIWWRCGPLLAPPSL